MLPIFVLMTASVRCKYSKIISPMLSTILLMILPMERVVVHGASSAEDAVVHL